MKQKSPKGLKLIVRATLFSDETRNSNQDEQTSSSYHEQQQQPPDETNVIAHQWLKICRKSSRLK